MEYEENTKSKFNAGLAKLERIGELRKGIHDARLNKDWEKWKACLEGIRSEIDAKLDDDERKECDKMETSIVEVFHNYYKTRGMKNNAHFIPRPILYKYELLIGKLEENTGMGMPDDDDDGL